MSAAILQAELSSLIQESKRKYPDVKAAAEKSLAGLKALHVTSEAQLAGDLLRRPFFIDPFILACNSRAAKLISSAVICLQRLAASRALPTERLRDVIRAFREVTSSSFDVQIKILQTLPSLLQTYASELQGDLLFTSLEICGALQATRNGVLSSTAAATLQQLVATAFERIADEDDADDEETLREVLLGEESAKLTQAASDGFDIFGDLCSLADGAALKRLKLETISPVFVHDLIIAILRAKGDLFHTHPELLHICRATLMPSLLRRLPDKQPFSVTVRSLKILLLLLSGHFSKLQDESGVALKLLIHVVETELSPSWKRAACMEALRHVISDFPLLCQVYAYFDMLDGREEVVGRMLTTLAKIAAEKPALIGLSHQSTLPTSQKNEGQDGKEQASLEVAGMEGVIGGTVTASSQVIGVIREWSVPKTPCLEQLDKNEAPRLPETYIYSLVLESICSLAEGLARYVTPARMPKNTTKKTQEQLVESSPNPNAADAISPEAKPARGDQASGIRKTPEVDRSLESRSHPQAALIRTATAFVTSCWPALLATFATFLNATLDSDFYHNLVRAIQKLTQVAGVLGLSTPRDAFLTTLGKAAVPSRGLQSASFTGGRRGEHTTGAQTAPEAAFTSTTPPKKLAMDSRSATRADISMLTNRNLLCLRALVYLGIALGPTLSQEAWFILLETLQEAERSISTSSHLLMNQDGDIEGQASIDGSSTNRAGLGGEVTAVQTASRKMFASASNYDKDALSELLKALLSLSVSTELIEAREQPASPTMSFPSRRAGRMHQSSRSTSGSLLTAATDDHELLFVLSKLSEIARSNLSRFAREPTNESGWSLIVDSLLHVTKSTITASEMRLRAASLIDSIITGTLQIDEDDERLQREVQFRCLLALRNQVDGIGHDSTSLVPENRTVDLEIHERAIETLVSVVEQHGENLLVSWKTIFELSGTVFDHSQQNNGAKQVRTRSPKLLSTSFRLLQLIGSDFLNLVPRANLVDFIDILLLFGRQTDDLNISLTSTTFFWNLADFLHGSGNHPSLSCFSDVPTEDALVTEIKVNRDQGQVAGSLWLVLLLRLSILTTDSRYEVRNGSIKVAMRILDVSGASLTSHGWHICLNLTIILLLNSHAAILGEIGQEGLNTPLDSWCDWHKSTIPLLEGSISLVAKYISTIATDEHFYVFWDGLFEILRRILAISSHAVSYAAFHGVSVLLSAFQNTGYQDTNVATPILRLWVACHPANIAAHPTLQGLLGQDQNSNQKAFAAHVAILVAVCEVFPSVNLNQIEAEDIGHTLKKTILRCVHPPYGSDILKMAPEQENVIAVLQLLLDTPGPRGRKYLQAVLDFVLIGFKEEKDLETPHLQLPPRQDAVFRNGQRPTFVAFSSRCMDILEAGTIKDIQQDYEIGGSEWICSVLDVFSRVMQAKYSSKAHRGDPLLWRKATASALAILELVYARRRDPADEDGLQAVHDIHNAAIEVVIGILGAGSLKDRDHMAERTTVLAEEEYDIAAFKRLSFNLIPALCRLKNGGNTAQQPKTCETYRKFATSLFHSSMIAAPQRTDLGPEEELSLSPSSTSSLFIVRPGTIKALDYHIRARIPYLALDTLFKLTKALDDEDLLDAPALAAHGTLAKTAAPYMLLRAAHTLKSFIADQPLRGSMPMPSRLRAEMTYVLKSCLELRFEDDAFVGHEGSSGCLGQDGRRPLRVLYPLILRVWSVWQRIPRLGFSWTRDPDGVEIERLLNSCMAACGECWNLPGVESQ